MEGLLEIHSVLKWLFLQKPNGSKEGQKLLKMNTSENVIAELYATLLIT